VNLIVKINVIDYRIWHLAVISWIKLLTLVSPARHSRIWCNILNNEMSCGSDTCY